MKLEYANEYNFYIYLNKYYLADLDISDKTCVEEYFKKMFANLKNNHHLDIYGYYNIRVYTNKHYGVIIDVFKLSNDYFKIPGNKVDMKIMIDSDSLFLYEIDDYFFIDDYKDYIKRIYCKDDKYYLELYDDVDESFYHYLMEHCHIIFNDNAYEIVATSSKL
jgi:hypothetical protein